MTYFKLLPCDKEFNSMIIDTDIENDRLKCGMAAFQGQKIRFFEELQNRFLKLNYIQNQIAE